MILKPQKKVETQIHKKKKSDKSSYRKSTTP